MDTIEFKLERQTFCAGETVLDTSVEQSVEKDFVLPDYCADIFRILKCVVDTRVLSQTINGGKLTFELGVSARVLYCSEGDSKVNCIVQKMNYTKSLDLADNCQSPSVFITSRCDYVNCRVISPRRLDIRGAVTSRIKVVCEKTQSIVTDASGGSIQLKKQLLTYPAKRLTADKRVTVIEELELAGDKPPVTQVIRTDCFIQPAEQKIIAGKLVTKGDANPVSDSVTVSRDKPALACGMCVLCSCRPVRYSIPAGGRSFHTLRCFELWLRIGAMGSRSKDDYRRDRFPGNTDSRYVPDCRHRIAKDLYPDDLRNSRDTAGAYPERVCPVLQQISK